MKNIKDIKVIHDDLKLLLMVALITVDHGGESQEVLEDILEKYNLEAFMRKFLLDHDGVTSTQTPLILEAIDRIQYKIEEFEALEYDEGDNIETN